MSLPRPHSASIPLLLLLAALPPFPSPARPPQLPPPPPPSWTRPAAPLPASPADAIPAFPTSGSSLLSTTSAVPVAPHAAVVCHPSGKPWQLLETEHFLIHHDQLMFARRVARLGEAFYAHIAADLPPGTPDRLSPARSAIYIFRKPEHWQAFLATQPGAAAWTASFVRGSALYLQATGSDTSSRMETFAHEMTHLVFHRFLAVQPPLWLHEGLAEFYGAVAYRAVRGMGQGRHAAIPSTRNLLPLVTLFSASSYPSDPELVRPYYRTAAAFVAFLRYRRDGAPWAAAWPSIARGDPPLPVILREYGFPTPDALQTEFDKFCR